MHRSNRTNITSSYARGPRLASSLLPRSSVLSHKCHLLHSGLIEPNTTSTPPRQQILSPSIQKLTLFAAIVSPPVCAAGHAHSAADTASAIRPTRDQPMKSNRSSSSASSVSPTSENHSLVLITLRHRPQLVDRTIRSLARPPCDVSTADAASTPSTQDSMMTTALTSPVYKEFISFLDRIKKRCAPAHAPCNMRNEAQWNQWEFGSQCTDPATHDLVGAILTALRGKLAVRTG